MPSVARCVVSEPLDLSGARSEAAAGATEMEMRPRPGLFGVSHQSVLGGVRTEHRAPINALFLPHGPPDGLCNRKPAMCVGGSRLMQKRSPVAMASDQDKK